MEVRGVESVSCRVVVFAGRKGSEHAVEVLHVGDVAANAEDGGRLCVRESAEAVDVGKAGERTVGRCGWGGKEIS